MTPPIATRRSAWITLLVALALLTALLGALRGPAAPTTGPAAPAQAESSRVAELRAHFPGADVQPVLLVATRTDGGALTPADLASVDAIGKTLPTVAGQSASAAMPSPDGAAAMVRIPVQIADDTPTTAKHVAELRQAVRAAPHDGLTLQVTGGPAFGADITKAFDGANVTLLLVTIGVVALLLLLTYRSPVLWLIPLTVVGFADQAAAAVTASLGRAFDLHFDAGIVSVLVFGAGTNYALLLISRYREELRRTPDHRAALIDAWRATGPAILASNATVVLALASLVLASIPGTRGLGVAAAAGLVVALVVVMSLLPAALSVVGRGAFWPLIPRPEAATPGATAGATSAHGDRPAERVSAWGRIASAVVAKPIPVVTGVLLSMLILAQPLTGASLGLTQTERFRSASESADGLRTLSQHFPAGNAQPLTVVAAPDRAAAVVDAARQVSGVVSARVIGGDSAHADISVVTDADPGSPQARDTVQRVRTAVHAVSGADAMVGGQQATDLDAREGNIADLIKIAPIVLAVNALVLILLTRALVAPLLLLAVNTLSALATLGLGWFVGSKFFNWPALDLQVPLMSFLFLVALGIDYTIFLVHRARAEARDVGTREGMVRAVGHTGVVITSAGIVLASVFAALGVLPLVTLGQIGLIVGLGVVLDTFVVRTVLVPGLFAILGERVWWPGGGPTQVR